MIICIPVFETRVSPRFDCAKEFLLAHIKGEDILNRKILAVDNLSINDRILSLKESNVDTLICGGIDNVSARLISRQNILVYSWITGEAEDALKCFINGNVCSGIMAASNGRRCGKWKFLKNQYPGSNKIKRRFRGGRNG